MKLLLDTHALLWFIGNNPQLSKASRQSIEDTANDKNDHCDPRSRIFKISGECVVVILDLSSTNIASLRN